MATTMSDIASHAGTSVAAVSVTLNGAKSTTLKLSPQTRERILRAAVDLGYRRNPLAGALATGKSHLLGLMLPHASSYGDYDPFFWLVITGAAAETTRQGYSLVLYAADEEEHGVGMITQLIEGLVLVSPPSGYLLYEECELQSIPYVSVYGDPRRAAMTLGSDDYRGAKLAARHLLELGHIRIAHLTGETSVTTTEPRLRGYQDALQERGIVPDATLCLTGGFNRVQGYSSARVMLERQPERRPTAIFAANDLSAHGALDAALELGLRVPEDLSIIGYDGTWYGELTSPRLTSVSMNVSLLGQRAVEKLLARIQGRGNIESHEVLPVFLIDRDSVSRPFDI